MRRTPLVPSATLSERLKTNVYVKLELFQKTGSFKVRGTFNKALSLAPEMNAKGLVTVSGGNHALAVAYTGAGAGSDGHHPDARKHARGRFRKRRAATAPK